jgi:tetratricopeptide (TPR) repeat protein
MRLFVHVLIALALVAFAADGRCLAEPPAARSAADANSFDAVAQDIVESVLALGYPRETADDLVRLVRGWQCEQWRQTLAQARARAAGRHSAELTRLEEDAIRSLHARIGREIVSCDPLDKKQMNRAFYLTKIVKEKTSQCLGYTQLYYILGKSIGLRVRPIGVMELVSGPLPTEEGHVACLVDRSDGKVMIVDVAMHYVSWPFVFQDEYAAAGDYWRFKRQGNPLALYRQIQILDENGLIADVYNNLALAYAETGHPAESLDCYNKAAELNPKSAEVFYNRGNAHRALENYPQALADYSRAIEISPKCAGAFNNRGVVHFTLGQQEQAISDFAKALEINPKYADAYNNRGNAHNALGQLEQALADYAKALELNPKSADAYNNRGITRIQSGQYAEAIPDLTKAIEINPQHDKAYHNRGVAYANLGKTDEAKKDLQKAAELNPASIDEIKQVSDTFQLGL